MRVVYKDPFRDFEVASNWVAIEQKEGQVRERRDPETHQAPPHRGEELEQWQLGQYARLAIEILGAQDWGDFELDALRLAFSFALQARDVGLQNGIRTRLNERSPGWEQAPLLDLGGNY
jgi:hypothetical protein